MVKTELENMDRFFGTRFLTRKDDFVTYNFEARYLAERVSWRMRLLLLRLQLLTMWHLGISVVARNNDGYSF